MEKTYSFKVTEDVDILLVHTPSITGGYLQVKTKDILNGKHQPFGGEEVFQKFYDLFAAFPMTEVS